jgi:hypothetical protein
MNTKNTLSTLALAAMGLAGSWQPAQGNVVGYANVPVKPGYNLIHNPLHVVPTDSIASVIPSPPQGTMVFLWDVPSQSFTPVTTYDPNSGGWDVPVNLPPGRGFVWYAPAAYTNTFVGEVLQGPLTNFIAGNNKLSALGSKVPQAGMLSTDLAFPTIDGANVLLFNGASQTYTDAFTCFKDFGWFDPNGVAGTGGPVISVAQAFFVQNAGPDTNWVRNFTVQLVSLPATAGAAISSLWISGGSVTLKVQNPSGAPYTIQFSSDGLSWTTVASKLTGSAWQGKYAGGERGYYQVIQP